MKRQYRDELLMLDALLAGKKLWDVQSPQSIQLVRMMAIKAALEREHAYLLRHEPTDEFHLCVLLGALNLVAGLLDASLDVDYSVINTLWEKNCENN